MLGLNILFLLYNEAFNPGHQIYSAFVFFFKCEFPYIVSSNWSHFLFNARTRMVRRN